MRFALLYSTLLTVGHLFPHCRCDTPVYPVSRKPDCWQRPWWGPRSGHPTEAHGGRQLRIGAGNHDIARGHQTRAPIQDRQRDAGHLCCNGRGWTEAELQFRNRSPRWDCTRIVMCGTICEFIIYTDIRPTLHQDELYISIGPIWSSH